MGKRGRGERIWAPPATGITANQNLIVKSENAHPRGKRRGIARANGKSPNFLVEQLSLNPASYIVTDQNGYDWEVYEGADGVLEIVIAPSYEQDAVKAPKQGAILSVVKSYRKSPWFDR